MIGRVRKKSWPQAFPPAEYTPAGGVAKQARAGFQAFPCLGIFLALCADSLTDYGRSESSRETCVIEHWREKASKVRVGAV